MFSILDYIGKGQENAVSVAELEATTGLDPRLIRREVQKARNNVAVINLQDGRGYFIPTKKDIEHLKHYINQERKRAMALLTDINTAEKTLFEFERSKA